MPFFLRLDHTCCTKNIRNIRNINMNVRIDPSMLHGTIRAIASKSQAHRMLICAAFADRPTRIICRERSNDIDATAECLRAIGCDIVYDEADGSFYVTPAAKINKNAVIDCGESGSTLRFLLPVVCALGIECTIVMHGRLPERPLSPLWEELEAHGCTLKRNPDRTISTSGSLRGGAFTLAADISSQFISGLLFAMPLIKEPSSLRLTGQIESRNYIMMTMDALKAFGAVTEWNSDTLTAPNGTGYHSPGEVTVEGDWSNGAFWLCASALTNGAVQCTGLDESSRQGDSAVTELIELISRGNAAVDARDVPDLVPVLSVLAAAIPGTTSFVHAERLRIKESDRIKTTIAMLRSLGAECSETTDGLTVTGGKGLSGGSVDSFNDHRIAMSAAVASIMCDGAVEISGAEAVKKSYPDFWRDFARLGGQVTVTE